MFWTVGALAGRLSFALWYLMAMEESSMAMARDMIRRPETETLGPLDPAFVSVHREHMKDEARHLHIDGRMIDLCIASGVRIRRIFKCTTIHFYAARHYPTDTKRFRRHGHPPVDTRLARARRA